MNIVNRSTNYSPKFSATILLDKKVINDNLAKCRKNDFLCNIFPQNNMEYKAFVDSTIATFYKEKTLNSYSSKLFNDSDANKAGYKLATIIKKKLERGEDLSIFKSLPDIFQGIIKEKLIEMLDILAYFTRKNLNKLPSSEISFDICGKNFVAKYLGQGYNAIITKLEDKSGRSVVMKSFKKPESMSNFGIFGELAAYQEFGDEDINNIPRLYFANPLSIMVQEKNKPSMDSYDTNEYFGAWEVVEFISQNTPVKKEGITLQDWLKNKHLIHSDLNDENCIGEYVVDLGGIGKLNKLLLNRYYLKEIVSDYM